MIHTIAGEVGGHPLENEAAVLDHDYNDEHRDVYVVTTGEQAGESALPGAPGDGIWEREEAPIIPTDDLRALKKASDSRNTVETVRLTAYIVSNNNIK